MMATLYTRTIIDKFLGVWHPFATPMTARARKVMENAHSTQLRKTGEPYTTHPTAVAQRCFDLYKDQTLVTAALLHDVIEDSPQWDLDKIEEQFGSHISFLVDGLTKTTLFLHKDKELVFLDYRHKLLWVGLEDIRVFIVKLADREHNLSTLRALSLGSQFRILRETVSFYIPLSLLIGQAEARNLEELRRKVFQTLLQNGLLTPSSIGEYLEEQGEKILYTASLLGSQIHTEEDFFALTQEKQQQVLEELYTCCQTNPLLRP